MVRNYQRKTDKGLYDEESMKNAIKKVKEGCTYADAARQCNVNRETLRRKCKGLHSHEDVKLHSVYNHRQVFTVEEEKKLASYLKISCQMFYGLTSTDCRKLAYETAVLNKMSYPKSWDENHSAGVEWLRTFMVRNKLSLRSPEGCSLGRATSFNRHNVQVFFNNMKELMTKVPSLGNPTRIYNLDETKTLTVQKSGRVVSEKNVKAVCKIKSQERGTLVTTCCIVRADGNTIPPVMIFPRANFKDYMLKGAPSNTLGLATSSGWMTSNLFVDTLKHFVKYSCSSLENPSLLIYDNHETHISIEVYEEAKKNGVHILTLPPHSTHKMQPLDVALYAPFQTYYNSAIDSWMYANPGKNVTIYEVAGFVGLAYPRAFTPSNIINAFRATGIYPMDPDVFDQSDFDASEVSNRPLIQQPSTSANTLQQLSTSANTLQQLSTSANTLQQPSTSANTLQQPSTSANTLQQPSTSANTLQQPSTSANTLQQLSTSANTLQQPSTSANTLQQPSTSAIMQFIEKERENIQKVEEKIKKYSTVTPQATASKKTFISPEDFKGYPKANHQNPTRKRRTAGKSRILTDTPEKEDLLQKQMKRDSKKQGEKTHKKRIKKEPESDDSEDLDDVLPLEDSDEGQKTFTVIDGDYVVVTYNGKKFPGQVIETVDNDDKVKVKHMTQAGMDSWRWPEIEDILWYDMDEILKIISPPTPINKRGLFSVPQISMYQYK
ncbi:hypothetical protein M8J76_012165 [Diaphorina citri]|nr:hypothetical protein M8J76_012165 [Diaphorina citri]KAI5725354.1 hypothetical protein M8J77_014428 [Diaphorina citri]